MSDAAEAEVPWHRARPADAPVTVTMPFQMAKRVFASVNHMAHRSIVRGHENFDQLKLMADAVNLIGDAIGAPADKRFHLSDDDPTVSRSAYHAVVAGSAREYLSWARENPGVKNPLYVGTVNIAKANLFTGWSSTGTGYRRDDFQEIVAAIRARTIR